MPGKLQECKGESYNRNEQRMEKWKVAPRKVEKENYKKRDDGGSYRNDSARQGDSDGACGLSGE